MDVLESTESRLDLENSPLWGLPPPDGGVLLLEVPLEPPFRVHRDVGENSGSLMGPLGPKGVRMVEGDWSMPRLWRYSGILSSIFSSGSLGEGVLGLAFQ